MGSRGNLYGIDDMIKLKDILNEILEDTPRVLYHATFKALLPSIRKRGLIGGGSKYRNFDNVEKGIYLGYSSEYAGSMIEASENPNIPEEWFDDIIILTIDTSKLDLNKLEEYLEKENHLAIFPI